MKRYRAVYEVKYAGVCALIKYLVSAVVVKYGGYINVKGGYRNAINCGGSGVDYYLKSVGVRGGYLYRVLAYGVQFSCKCFFLPSDAGHKRAQVDIGGGRIHQKKK